MAFWLADQRNDQDADWIQRFDPRFWTVNFPRPMMAALTCPSPDTLRADVTFLREGDLAGVIWESSDQLDHPLLRYETDRDYSRTRLSFRWRSDGVLPLDAVNGPTLTIEGEDETGNARTWYVRLWNYAQGTASDARIVLNFSDLAGGFLLPEEAQPVSPHKIERMFISLVATGFVPGSIKPLAAPANGWAELSEIRCEGHRCLLEIGDVIVPPHGLAIATAYDDCTNQTPQRLVRKARQLGYRGSLLHYAGMSHFMRLSASGTQFSVATEGEPLCAPARAWHRAFFTAAGEAGFSPILSLSYELLAQYCPDPWQQRSADGEPGRTGWDPPSALLSPANQEAMAWLQKVAQSFVGLMRESGVPVRFHVRADPIDARSHTVRVVRVDGDANGLADRGARARDDAGRALRAHRPGDRRRGSLRAGRIRTEPMPGDRILAEHICGRPVPAVWTQPLPAPAESQPDTEVPY